MALLCTKHHADHPRSKILQPDLFSCTPGSKENDEDREQSPRAQAARSLFVYKDSVLWSWISLDFHDLEAPRRRSNTVISC